MRATTSRTAFTLTVYMFSSIIIPFIMNLFTGALQETMSLGEYVWPLAGLLLISSVIGAFLALHTANGKLPGSPSTSSGNTPYPPNTGFHVNTPYSSDTGFDWVEWLIFSLAIGGGVFGFAKAIIGGHGVIGAIAGFLGGFVGIVFAISFAIQFIPVAIILAILGAIIYLVFYGLVIIFS